MQKQGRRFRSALSILLSVLMLAAVLLGTIQSTLALEAVPPPIDPQSWQLSRDKTFDDYKPNPVINWMTEFNPQSIARPTSLRNNTAKTAIAGGLIMIEYLDRKFISRGDVGSDPLGYYLYKQDGSGLADTKSNNPIYNVPQLVADEKHGGDISKVTDAEFAQWWADYLNKPQEINNGLTINEFWRENSYGKWSIDLTPYGPYTIPYFEFETMGYDQGSSSFQTYRDQPPSFRRGSSGTSSGFGFDSVAATLVDSYVTTGDFDWNNIDFFFWLHAGYDESGVWQEFGMNQFPSRKDVPYELGPGPRMKKVEEFFTENPQWLTTYAARYNGGSNSTTATRDFWAGELAKYNALVAAGTPELYEFKLSQADWDWVNTYNDGTTKNTRYVNFTSWEACVGEWSHMSSITRNSRTIRYSTQGENDGMATFAHEFGHIGGLSDNYGNPYTARLTAATEPWELMSRGSFAGPFGDHARWTVPGIEAGSVPVHFLTYNKIAIGSTYYDTGDVLTLSKQDLAGRTPLVAEIVARNVPLNNAGYYPQLEQYGLKSPNYYKAIRLNFASGTGTWGDQATTASNGFTQFGGSIANGRMGIEVVQRTGYDSFAPDDGVMITRNNRVVDSHNYDIALVDYTVKDGFGIGWDDHVSYTVGHAAQLWDSAFHVGKSFTDTGYYRTIYSDNAADDFGTRTTAITNQQGPRYYASESSGVTWQRGIVERGSIMQWEEQGDREIASGDTINEWHDTRNDLHFYILAKNMHEGPYGDFLSYTVGMRHGAGTAVSGQLAVVPNVAEAEIVGRVAVVNFDITNTGATATDIIRVDAKSGLDVTILNDLYAIAPGETVTVPVYVSYKSAANLANLTVGLDVSSESNANNKASASIGALEAFACTVSFEDVDNEPYADLTQKVVYSKGAVVPEKPEKFGYTLIGWALDGEDYDFETPVIDDITLVAQWSRNPVTFLEITSSTGTPAPASVTVLRNSIVTFDYVINADALREDIVWTVSNPALVTVDAESGAIFVKNMTGTVLLTAKDSYGGIVAANIVLRII
ncbi:MAG: immune inhibitor A [Oscillospiraceae bacterium]|nr:immune inhibitor A [Oscillospiraceae bacterium]